MWAFYGVKQKQKEIKRKLNYIYDNHYHHCRHFMPRYRSTGWLLLSKSSLNSKARFIIEDAKKCRKPYRKGKCTGRKYKEGKNVQAKEKFLELKAEHDNNIQQREKKMQEAEKEQRIKKTSLMMSFLKSGS